MLKNFLLPAIISIALLSCKPSIKPETLYGKWHYTCVYKPEANPPDSVTRYELAEMKPYIEFSTGNKLLIMWGGKVLSRGTFRIDGDNIHFNEVFEDGQSREFPFYVSKLTNTEIIFETVGKDGSRVTAVKGK